MPKVTWLGVDSEPDCKETGMKNYVFKKGEAVEVDDPFILLKCYGNKYFEVEGWEPEEETETYPTAVGASAQGPVSKPTEPKAKWPGT